MALTKGSKKEPEFTEVTVARPMLGHDRDEDGRRIRLAVGDDTSLPTATAKRLARSSNPRCVIDPDLRKEVQAAAKKGASALASAAKKADK